MTVTRRAWLGGAAALLATSARVRAQVPVEAPRQITVRATPITSFSVQDEAQRRFGALEFRGGLTLASGNKHFGGYSGLRVAADGEHFIAVSDRGTWLRGRITYRGAVPASIEDAEVAPLLGADGRPLAERRWFDAESLADDGGTLYVGFERVNGIARFDYGAEGLLARGEAIAVPDALKSLPNNKGIEALAFAPAGHPLAGTLVAISERGLDRAANVIGFLIGGPRPGQFSVKRSDDFDVTDAVFMPGGDLLILERYYSPLRGVGMRMRRIAAHSIAPGVTLDGRILIEADLGFQIDNMEGLGVHRNTQGEIILTIISDDNYSLLQRTVLLQFALVGE